MPAIAPPKRALQSLEKLVTAAQAMNTVSPLAILAWGSGYKPFLVAGLHSKGCTTATEILVLLKAGLADGAMARGRSLCEIELIAGFIAAHDEEIAERYHDHAAIKNWESARAILEAVKATPSLSVALPDGFAADLKQKRDDAVGKYGTKFKHEYGWAANVVGIDKTNGPNRGDLERALGRGNRTPLYQAASYQVHPTANAVLGFAGRGIQSIAMAGEISSGCLRDLTHTFIQVCVPLERQPGVTKSIDGLADDAIAAFSVLP